MAVSKLDRIKAVSVYTYGKVYPGCYGACSTCFLSIECKGRWLRSSQSRRKTKLVETIDVCQSYFETVMLGYMCVPRDSTESGRVVIGRRQQQKVKSACPDGHVSVPSHRGTPLT